jgi:hypothetical protein
MRSFNTTSHLTRALVLENRAAQDRSRFYDGRVWGSRDFTEHLQKGRGLVVFANGVMIGFVMFRQVGREMVVDKLIIPVPSAETQVIEILKRTARHANTGLSLPLIIS